MCGSWSEWNVVNVTEDQSFKKFIPFELFNFIKSILLRWYITMLPRLMWLILLPQSPEQLAYFCKLLKQLLFNYFKFQQAHVVDGQHRYNHTSSLPHRKRCVLWQSYLSNLYFQGGSLRIFQRFIFFLNKSTTCSSVTREITVLFLGDIPQTFTHFISVSLNQSMEELRMPLKSETPPHLQYSWLAHKERSSLPGGQLPHCSVKCTLGLSQSN